MANEACATDILVDLSMPKVTPKKCITASQDLLTAKQNSNSNPMFANDCATGVLIDFDDEEEFRPPSEKKKKEMPVQCAQSTDGNSQVHLVRSSTSTSDSLILDMESLDGIAFDFNDDDEDASRNVASNQKSPQGSQPLGPLNACQMAEIFEQANTIAVRIELANVKLCTPGSKKRSASDAPSSEGRVAHREDTNRPSPDELPTTSTPTEKVAPGVDIHFLGAESSNIQMKNLEEQQKPKEPDCRVVRMGSLKQPLAYSQERKTTRTIQRLATPVTKVVSSKTTPASRAVGAKNGAVSSATGDCAGPNRPAKSRVSLLAPHPIQPELKKKTRVSEALARTPRRSSPSVVRPSSSQRLNLEPHSQASGRMKAPAVRTKRNIGKENTDDHVSKLPAARPGLSSAKSSVSSKTGVPRNVGAVKNQPK